MKQILGVIGSPRRGGNTDILIQRMLAAAQERCAATETIYLGGLDICECDGCHGCWWTGQCNKDDDMIALYSKISSSDAVIFGTPVYWYGPTGLMKTFIDRFVYFNSPAGRELIRGKKAVVVVPCEEEAEETAALTLQFFEKSLGYLEMKLTGRLVVPGVTERGEVATKLDVLETAGEFGRQLVL